MTKWLNEHIILKGHTRGDIPKHPASLPKCYKRIIAGEKKKVKGVRTNDNRRCTETDEYVKA